MRLSTRSGVLIEGGIAAGVCASATLASARKALAARVAKDVRGRFIGFFSLLLKRMGLTPRTYCMYIKKC
jgi:hypothetical protein